MLILRRMASNISKKRRLGCKYADFFISRNKINQQNPFNNCVEACALTLWLNTIDHLAFCLVSREQYLKLMPLLVKRIVWPMRIYNECLSSHFKEFVSKMSVDGGDVISSGALPSQLTFLKIRDSKFNQDLVQDLFPPNLKFLQFPITWSSKYGSKRFNPPQTLETIKCARRSHVIENLAMLTNLTTLSFPDNMSLLHCSLFEMQLPSSLLQLSLNCTNKPLFVEENDRLPPNLTYLMLTNFVQSLSPKMFPATLQELELPITEAWPPYTLPASLTALRLPSYNDVLLANMLPTNLTSLKLPSFRNHYLFKNILPLSLQTLDIAGGFYEPISSAYTTLTSLRVRRSRFRFQDFPQNLSSLHIASETENDKLIASCTESACMSSLKKLTIMGVSLRISSFCFASSLVELHLYCQCVSLIDVFPPSLRYLKVNGKKLDFFALPQSVTTLSLDFFAPAQVAKLFHDIDAYPALTNLKFGAGYTSFQFEGDFVFPRNLHKINFGLSFKDNIPKAKLPIGLRKLTCSSRLREQLEGFTFQHYCVKNSIMVSIYFF